MPKNKINPLNRRLKKTEVKDFIENGAELHEEYSKEYYEKYWNENEKQDLVYELPNGNFILVFDLKGDILPGKSNYYTKDNCRFGYLVPLERISWNIDNNQTTLLNSITVNYTYYFTLTLGICNIASDNGLRRHYKRQ